MNLSVSCAGCVSAEDPDDSPLYTCLAEEEHIQDAVDRARHAIRGGLPGPDLHAPWRVSNAGKPRSEDNFQTYFSDYSC